jgi:hypothetical protein
VLGRASTGPVSVQRDVGQVAPGIAYRRCHRDAASVFSERVIGSAGWDLHPLESAALPRRTPCRPSKSPRNCYVCQMRTIRDVTRFLEEQPLLMELLRAVATLAIDDCWIGAGVFVMLSGITWSTTRSKSLQGAMSTSSIVIIGAQIPKQTWQSSADSPMIGRAFPDRCAIKPGCTNGMATRHIGTVKMRFDAGQKQQPQLQEDCATDKSK